MRAPPESDQDGRFKTTVQLLDGRIGRSKAHELAYSRGFFDSIQVGSTLLRSVRGTSDGGNGENEEGG